MRADEAIRMCIFGVFVGRREMIVILFRTLQQNKLVSFGHISFGEISSLVFETLQCISFESKSDIEGLDADKKKKKSKNISGTQPKARAGWPKRLRLVQATPRADFAVLDVQHCSTVTAIFSWVDNFAFNYYSRPRF